MDNQIEELNKRISRTKKDLMKWEFSFFQKHGCKPTIKDISERPSIEKFYKKYNKLKKELKSLNSQDDSSQASSSVCSPQTQSMSPERKNSVEFIKSPSNRMTKVKTFFSQDSIEERIQIRRASEIEEMKMAIQESIKEDDFWLNKSSSQPLPSDHAHKPRLILGGSQPKKRVTNIQNPSQRRKRLQQELEKSLQATKENEIPISSNNNYHKELLLSEIQKEDDEMEGIKVVNHEINPFRYYDPSLFNWDDPTFSVGPGFFGSSKAYTSFMIPILNEPLRRDRVLKKLEKGTLGEVLEENKRMEQELDDEIRQFIHTNTIMGDNSFENAIAPIDKELLNSKPSKKIYEYKKKPIQKRQTKLFKLKFVET